MAVPNTFAAATSATGQQLDDNFNYCTTSPTFSGTPVFSNAITLPNSSVATTQPIGDSSTKVATDLFVQTAINVNNFRLTLTTATPVTTADVTAATIVYCTPYNGNKISLWNGTAFQIYTSAEFSIALGTLTSGKPYDVFCFQNAGVPTLELGTAWTNDTTRAVALAYQNGILVKSGDATRRYLGTFYTTSTTTTEDSQANRYLWNYYNRVSRQMKRRETTASWTYTTATIRQANANAANQINFVIGVSEDAVNASLISSVNNNTAGIYVANGIGLDSITAASPDTIGTGINSSGAGYGLEIMCAYDGFPGAGRHYLSWLEYSAATGITTWNGTPVSATMVISGLNGRVMA